MKKRYFPSYFKHSFLSLLLAASFFFSAAQNSSALNAHADTDHVRKAWVTGEGRCQTERLKFAPLGPNDDMYWELDNPVCIAFGAAFGATVIGSEMAANAICNNTNPAKMAKEAAEIGAEKASGFWVTLRTMKRTVSGWASCGVYTAQCTPVTPGKCAQAVACCTSIAAKTAAVGIATGELAAIWGAAIEAQKNTHLCGETWNTWQQKEPESLQYNYGRFENSYQKQLENKFEAGTMALDIKNKDYREYIYGGQEYEDAGSNTCANPSGWDKETRIKILGYSSDRQRYYMRGPRVASNYQCSRFLLGTKSDASSKEAYECCKKRSQETICIEETKDIFDLGVTTPKTHRFCKLGERCKVGDVWYDIHPAEKIQSHICATTYSVCPYNHNLGGSTEIQDLSKPSDGNPPILLNHCQYLKHCAKIPNVPYIRTSDLDGGWISSACFDLKGDSQNNYGYTADLVPINTKNFSAPIAQCFKETLENVFINKAGHTQCMSPDEKPDKNGVCVSGYRYQDGKVIEGQKSFFQILQDRLRFAIQLVMTVAITIMGISVLLTGSPWNKKTIMMFVMKLGLVMYFALGTAWQDYFFNGVSSSSMALADIFFRLDEGEQIQQEAYQDTKSLFLSSAFADTDQSEETQATQSKKDGCQFPKYNYADQNEETRYDNPSYPPGKQYLKIWDMLDCKIAKAIGLGPEASVPNLIYMILAGFLTGGYGIIFFIATFIFAFYLIALTVRALHVFLISSMAITIMIYVSPITITTCLFKRTEGIFKSWRTNLLSFVLQPVVLFIYLGFLITLFEGTMIGSATFSGDGKSAPKTINCNAAANNDSIYCIFKLKDIKTNNSLSPIGIALPVLADMNAKKMNTIIKAAFLMFIFTKFLDKIIDIAKTLLGGAGLVSNSMGALRGAGAAFGYAKAVQSRGTNATRKWGGKTASWAGDKAKYVKSAANILGKKGNKSGDSISVAKGGGDSISISGGKSSGNSVSVSPGKKP
ncbi:MAG: type secretion system protein VirB6 [Rickettsiaceae bacterium]|nr:type secretion system protein VirB6 [Rickettsiaceae bacterium]